MKILTRTLKLTLLLWGWTATMAAAQVALPTLSNYISEDNPAAAQWARNSVVAVTYFNLKFNGDFNWSQPPLSSSGTVNGNQTETNVDLRWKEPGYSLTLGSMNITQAQDMAQAAGPSAEQMKTDQINLSGTTLVREKLALGGHYADSTEVKTNTDPLGSTTSTLTTIETLWGASLNLAEGVFLGLASGKSKLSNYNERDGASSAEQFSYMYGLGYRSLGEDFSYQVEWNRIENEGFYVQKSTTGAMNFGQLNRQKSTTKLNLEAMMGDISAGLGYSNESQQGSDFNLTILFAGYNPPGGVSLTLIYLNFDQKSSKSSFGSSEDFKMKGSGFGLTAGYAF